MSETSGLEGGELFTISNSLLGTAWHLEMRTVFPDNEPLLFSVVWLEDWGEVQTSEVQLISASCELNLHSSSTTSILESTSLLSSVTLGDTTSTFTFSNFKVDFGLVEGSSDFSLVSSLTSFTIPLCWRFNGGDSWKN